MFDKSNGELPGMVHELILHPFLTVSSHTEQWLFDKALVLPLSWYLLVQVLGQNRTQYQY